MKYCAVAMKTESGDLYSYLIQYNEVCEVPVRIHERMDEELAYVYEIQVDSGIDSDVDSEIGALIEALSDKLMEEQE